MVDNKFGGRGASEILGLFCWDYFVGPGHYFGRKTEDRKWVVVICWYYLNVGIRKRGLVMATLGSNLYFLANLKRKVSFSKVSIISSL